MLKTNPELSLDIMISEDDNKEENKIETEDLKKEEIKYIDNPLPVPKRREHTGMDFLISVSDDDDFDLKDMTGIDFFELD